MATPDQINIPQSQAEVDAQAAAVAGRVGSQQATAKTAALLGVDGTDIVAIQFPIREPILEHVLTDARMPATGLKYYSPNKSATAPAGRRRPKGGQRVGKGYGVTYQEVILPLPPAVSLTYPKVGLGKTKEVKKVIIRVPKILSNYAIRVYLATHVEAAKVNDYTEFRLGSVNYPLTDDTYDTTALADIQRIIGEFSTLQKTALANAPEAV